MQRSLENTTYNDDVNQSIETTPEMKQTPQLVYKDIKAVILISFHMLNKLAY